MYNPGVTYQGGELMARGISQAGNALSDGLQRYAANKEESAALDTRFESTAKPLMEKLRLYGQLADENSPAAALLDKSADWHKLGTSQKKVLLADMMLLGDKTEAEQRRKQEDQWKLLAEQDRQEHLKLAQAADARAGELSAVMLPLHRMQTAGMQQQQEENAAIGQGLATFARGGTNVNPVSYSDWAAQAAGLGASAPPVGSTPFTYDERVMRALQTPGLGGRGAVQLQAGLERFAPKQPNELDAAHAAYWRTKAAQEAGDNAFSFDPARHVVPLGSGLPNAFYTQTGPRQGQVVYNTELPSNLPTVEGRVPVPDGHGGVKFVASGELSESQREGIRSKVIDQNIKLHSLRDLATSEATKKLYTNQILENNKRLDDLNGQKPPAEPSGPNPSAAAAPSAPKVGEERKGYVFLGGDPSQQSSWRKK